MKPTLVSRTQPCATSNFAEMSILAAETGAVNLGQGFPDTDGRRRRRYVVIDRVEG